MTFFSRIVIIHGITEVVANRNRRSLNTLLEEQLTAGNYELVLDVPAFKYCKKNNGNNDTYMFLFDGRDDIPVIIPWSGNEPSLDALLTPEQRRTFGSAKTIGIC